MLAGSSDSIQSSVHAVVLLSGGADSAALLHFLRSQEYIASLQALYVDYGQPARHFESAAAERIATHYEVPLVTVSVSGLPVINTGLVFGRNALLLLIAASHMVHKAGFLGIGVHCGTGYPDCGEYFRSSIQHLLDIYSHGRMRVLIPFAEWSKKQIIEYGHAEGVPLNLTRSCEADAETPCGECLSCKDWEELDACSRSANIA